MTTKTNSSHADVIKETISQNLHVFKSFKENLNKISETIKEVEKLLQENGLCVPFYLAIGNTSRFLEEYGPYDKKTTYLAWKKDKNGSYRLMFCEVAWECKFEEAEEVVSWEGEDLPIVYQSPFIETKSEVRLKEHNHLSEFIKHFALHVTTNPSDLPF